MKPNRVSVYYLVHASLKGPGGGGSFKTEKRFRRLRDAREELATWIDWADGELDVFQQLVLQRETLEVIKQVVGEKKRTRATLRKKRS